MVITESQMGFGRNISGLNLLDNMSYLTEAESVYAPAMVPVLENNRLGSYMISLENLMTFAESNGIEDLGYALSCVCEASHIDPSYTSLSVEKHTLIEDANIANLTRSLLNEGVNVYAKPVSPNSAVAVLGEFCMDHLFNTGDWSLLEGFVDDSILNEAFDTSQINQIRELEGGLSGEQLGNFREKLRTLEGKKHTVSNSMILKAYKLATGANFNVGTNNDSPTVRNNGLNISKNTVTTLPPQPTSPKPKTRSGRPLPRGTFRKFPGSDDGWDIKVTRGKGNVQGGGAPAEGEGGGAPAEAENVQNAIETATKDWQSKPRKWFAEKIAWLHDKAQEYNEKVHKDGKNAKWYQKILSYITRAIAFLTKKMHNLVAEKGKEIGDSKDGNYAYSSFHKSK